MRQCWSVRWLVVLGLWGCDSSDTGVIKEEPPMDACDVRDVGYPVDCSHASPLCWEAEAECVGGSPTTLGSCVCSRAKLFQVGPVGSFVDKLEAGAFGTDAFYWSEYHAIPGSWFSTIVKGPIGEPAQELVPMVAGGIDGLRVTEDTLYVRTNPPSAFTLSGEPLPKPDPDVAFPPSPVSRLTSDEMGLYLDGEQIYERPLRYVEVPDGVYVVAYDWTSGLDFISFADPSNPSTVVDVPWVNYKAPVIDRVWVSGSHVYLSTLQPNGVTFVMSYANPSIIGQ